MQHKNDYTCIAYFNEQSPKKWQFVHKLKSFADFLSSKHATWLYFNVYERRTGKYIKRFYKGNFIPYFLPVFLVGISLFFLTFNNTYAGCFASLQSPLNDFNNTATIWTFSEAPKQGGCQ
jgi:hypothetical protein